MTNSQPEGYIAAPASGEGPPVLVLHAWWGLNDSIKNYCDRLAEAGFTAFAPDLYHGAVTEEIAEAEKLSEPLFADLEKPRNEVAQAARFLSEQSGQADNGLVVIGFSLGAFFALDLSARAPEQVRSVVAYYGTCPVDYSASRADYLGHFAADDDFEPSSEVDQLEDSLQRAGRPVTFYRYADTGHWFCEPDRPQAYNQPAADLAWERTLAFLRRSEP